MSCNSTAAGIRRFEVTAATLTSDAIRARAEGGGGFGNIIGGSADVELAKEATAEVVAQSNVIPHSTRGRDACVFVSIALGIVTVIGLIVVIDPF